MPRTLKYEPVIIVAEGDLVIVHGRFSGFGAPVNWIAADIHRIEDGVLVEHWEVIHDEPAPPSEARLNHSAVHAQGGAVCGGRERAAHVNHEICHLFGRREPPQE